MEMLDRDVSPASGAPRRRAHPREAGPSQAALLQPWERPGPAPLHRGVMGGHGDAGALATSSERSLLCPLFATWCLEMTEVVVVPRGAVKWSLPVCQALC